jgi:hypothetical protein
MEGFLFGRDVDVTYVADGRHLTDVVMAGAAISSIQINVFRAMLGARHACGLFILFFNSPLLFPCFGLRIESS